MSKIQDFLHALILQVFNLGINKKVVNHVLIDVILSRLFLHIRMVQIFTEFRITTSAHIANSNDHNKFKKNQKNEKPVHIVLLYRIDMQETYLANLDKIEKKPCLEMRSFTLPLELFFSTFFMNVSLLRKRARIDDIVRTNKINIVWKALQHPNSMANLKFGSNLIFDLNLNFGTHLESIFNMKICTSSFQHH